MTTDSDLACSPRGSKGEIEAGTAFSPLFDPHGLIPAIVSDASSGQVLMFAYMNREALASTLRTGYGHFWSRSRERLWQKGEDSGNKLRVVEVRTDCDQDVVWLRAVVEGDGVACHTGAPSCFYRRLAGSPTASPHLEHAPLVLPEAACLRHPDDPA